MDQPRAQPDSILVSAETVNDFQLAPGDPVNLRLQDARTHQLATVPFHYVGVVAEFPTAPKDSFFVANAAYIAQQTGSDAVGAFLVDTAAATPPRSPNASERSSAPPRRSPTSPPPAARSAPALPR